MRVMLGSLVSLVTALISRPAATTTTLLYHSDLLPRNFNSRRRRLERLVQRDYLVRENCLFSSLINVLRCFW
ncbi:hypothetical protein ACFX13_047456 [Malus domestica]